MANATSCLALNDRGAPAYLIRLSLPLHRQLVSASAYGRLLSDGCKHIAARLRPLPLGRLPVRAPALVGDTSRPAYGRLLSDGSPSALAEKKGTALYAEVPPEAIPNLLPKLQESKIFNIKKLIVDKAKPHYKPVRSTHMIKLTSKTKLTELQAEPQNFPKYTFFLVPFPDLPKYETNKEYFIDVIGRIVALSDPTRVTTSMGIVRTKRLVHLMDLRATSACRWYINVAEIPEITAFYTSIPDHPCPMQKINLEVTDQLQTKIEVKTLLQLKSADLFEDLRKRFECTITITKIAENQSWCCPACPRCNTGTKFDSGVYTCNKEGTVCPQVVHRYKLCFNATDGTWELGFILFDERATTLIGKTAEKLLKQYNKFEIPPEITALVAEKMTVVVKIAAAKNVSKPDEEPTFEILNIKKRHGKDLLACQFKKQQTQTIVPTTSSYCANLPPLIPLQPKKEDEAICSQALSPNDIQLMEIDQTNFVDSFNQPQKRPFEICNDSDRELSDSTVQGPPLTKKCKK
ncbi:hypothetical protein BS78_03G237200 [Paspalum vaginatum]|nr:hypothetical protein BS78_03G237200 [Paspalum vaginatum]